jgi:phasin family protein
MTRQLGNQAFSQAEQFLRDARLENVQAIAQQSVAKTQEFYAKSAATAQESAKVLTEVAETTWGSTKMLNDKLVQNFTANIEASFSAAHAIAKAQSLPEALKLQSELFQKLAVQTTEQTKEFFDLSTRATQHVFEQVRAATSKAIKPTTGAPQA